VDAVQILSGERQHIVVSIPGITLSLSFLCELKIFELYHILKGFISKFP
jgi:hypothetical protein